jgi:hypothetical protein
MAQNQTDMRKTRLAAALKENLKRRKAQERSKGGATGAGTDGVAGNKPEQRPKSAPKYD